MNNYGHGTMVFDHVRDPSLFRDILDIQGCRLVHTPYTPLSLGDPTRSSVLALGGLGEFGACIDIYTFTLVLLLRYGVAGGVVSDI